MTKAKSAQKRLSVSAAAATPLLAGTAEKAAEDPATPVTGSDEVPGFTGEDAYNRFLADAQAVAPPVLPFRADASLAYHNVSAGLTAVLAREAQTQTELPAFDLEAAKTLPDLSLALVFAATKVDRSPGSSGQTKKLLARASTLRSLLLVSADALAHAGILSLRAVEKIRAGRGPIDLTTDCVELAGLFRSNADAIGGRTAVGADQIDEAAAVGTELLGLLRPKGTPQPGTPKALKAAAELRDRFWTLLVRRHTELRRAGAWLFLDALDQNVPALQSRTWAKRKTAPPVPAPATPTT